MAMLTPGSIPCGDFQYGATVTCHFPAYGSSGESLTISNLALADVLIYKGTSVTQRSSTAGIVLTATDGIDIDSVTGYHGFTIDTSDNTDTGFYAPGNDYTVVVSPFTINAQTTHIQFTFSIENRHSSDILLRTTIATLASQTSFTLSAGSTDDNAYNGCEIVVKDQASTVQLCQAVISDYTGSTKTITLLSDPAVFTIASGDYVTIYRSMALKASVPERTLDVASTGEAGLDFNNVLSTGVCTLHSLTITGATTLTGAVSLGSTLTVTGATSLSTLATSGSTTLNSLTVTNATTLSGAVSLGSTLTVTGATSLAAVSASGTLTVGALTVSGATTLTGAVTATNASNDIAGIDVKKISGDSGAADNCEAWFDGTGYASTGNTVTTVTSASLASGAITATSIASAAFTAAKFDTGCLTAAKFAAGAIDAAALASDVITDIWQGTALTEAYAADNAAATPAQLLYMIWALLAEKSVSGTTMTIKKLDGSTTAMTMTLGDATNPTSITRAS